MKEIRNFVSFAPSSAQIKEVLNWVKIKYLFLLGFLCLTGCSLFQSEEISFDSHPTITLANFAEIKEEVVL